MVLVFHCDILTQTWTVIPASQTPTHPVARLGHSAVSVYDPDSGSTHPALLIMWGDGGGEILGDSWIFHLNQQQWRKVVKVYNMKFSIPPVTLSIVIIITYLWFYLVIKYQYIDK